MNADKHGLSMDYQYSSTSFFFRIICVNLRPTAVNIRSASISSDNIHRNSHTESEPASTSPEANDLEGQAGFN
jgi:hypothetical protein